MVSDLLDVFVLMTSVNSHVLLLQWLQATVLLVDSVKALDYLAGGRHFVTSSLRRHASPVINHQPSPTGNVQLRGARESCLQHLS